MRMLPRQVPAVAICIAVGGCIPVRLPETPTVSGVVVDALTSQPVEGVRVFFMSSPSLVAVTSADGRFSLVSTSKWHVVPLVGVLDRFDSVRLVADAPGYDRGIRNYTHSAERKDERIVLTAMR